MSNRKKIAVILSGCGVYDGSEIHEATMTLYSIALHGADYQVFAPDTLQYHVVNHLTGVASDETRNVLVESARIARGKAEPLSKLSPNDFDGLILPGGFGAAKNLSTFAFEGGICTVNPDVERVILAMHRLKKPIGALCIAPAILARVLGTGVVSIGNDPKTSAIIEGFGAKHRNTNHGEVMVDEDNLLLTTPCYMLDANIVDIANGAKALVGEMLKRM